MTRKTFSTLVLFLAVVFIVPGIACSGTTPLPVQDEPSDDRTVPRSDTWGIYGLDLSTGDVELFYSSASKIAGLQLSPAGDRFAFSLEADGLGREYEEICTLSIDGGDFRRLTNNSSMDTYPAWSPDGSQIAFLSWGETSMDIYVMDADGGNERLLYGSGSHDGDVHWGNDKIVFTRNSGIWMMNADGTAATQVTNPPRAGVWGGAVLPFGDYDPRLSPDGTKIVFERLEGDDTRHGNYNLYVVNVDGSGELALTQNGYTQGLAKWSPSGDRIVYLVSAIGEEGKYDIYLMNADGSENRDIMPDYFPAGFLAHSPVFSLDDARVYFVGQWWE